MYFMVRKKQYIGARIIKICTGTDYAKVLV